MMFSRGSPLSVALVAVAVLTSNTVVTAFAPSGHHGAALRSPATAKTALTSFAPGKHGARLTTSLKIASFAPPVVLEDKPHLMIGGRNSGDLVVDMTEFDQAKQAMANQQKKKTALKLVAAYMAVICGSFYLRQLLALASVLNIPYYYKTYPLIAGMATCGIKSMIADCISQLKSWNGTFCWKRSLCGLTYGAAILGAGSKIAYTQVLPRICPSGVAGIAMQCGLDNFVFAPLIWIPGAYVMKSLFFGKSVMNALGTYVKDIREESLLGNYWKLWVPAQLLNFSVMPSHLRVPFVAFVGFIWFLILMNLQYRKQG